MLLLLLPSILSNEHQNSKLFVEIDCEDNSLSSRIELLRRLLFVLFESVEGKWITFFEISYAEREEFRGSISIHFLSFIGMMLGESTSSLLCGFAFGLRSGCKILHLQL